MIELLSNFPGSSETGQEQVSILIIVALLIILCIILLTIIKKIKDK